MKKRIVKLFLSFIILFSFLASSSVSYANSLDWVYYYAASPARYILYLDHYIIRTVETEEEKNRIRELSKMFKSFSKEEQILFLDKLKREDYDVERKLVKFKKSNEMRPGYPFRNFIGDVDAVYDYEFGIDVFGKK